MNKLMLLLLFIPVFAQAQIITTFAGISTSGFSGDGGMATNAMLSDPQNMIIDGLGNIYLTDYGNSRVRKINTSGIISTIAGNGSGTYSGDGGSATDAGLESPTGIVVDGANNIYVVCQGDNRVRKINTSGIITTFAGTGTGGFSGDGGPATAAELHIPGNGSIDQYGNVLITDLLNRRVRKVDTSGIISTIAGTGVYGYSGDGGPATVAALSGPLSTRTSSSRNIYIVDAGNVVRKIFAPTISISTSTSDTICTGITITFSSSVAFDAGTAHYQWKLNNLNVGSDSAHFSTSALTTVDTIFCELLDTTAGQVIATSNKIIITVVPLPVAGTIIGLDSVCAGSMLTLSATSPGGSWACTNTNASVSDSGVVNGAIAGTDTIIYSVTNSCGMAVTSFPILVNSEAHCDSVLDVQSIPHANSIRLYPNPAYDELTITAVNNINTLSIIDHIGHTLYVNKYSAKRVQINIASLPTGIYFIVVNDIYFQKLVKE